MFERLRWRRLFNVSATLKVVDLGRTCALSYGSFRRGLGPGVFWRDTTISSKLFTKLVLFRAVVGAKPSVLPRERLLFFETRFH